MKRYNILLTALLLSLKVTVLWGQPQFEKNKIVIDSPGDQTISQLHGGTPITRDALREGIHLHIIFPSTHPVLKIRNLVGRFQPVDPVSAGATHVYQVREADIPEARRADSTLELRLHQADTTLPFITLTLKIQAGGIAAGIHPGGGFAAGGCDIALSYQAPFCEDFESSKGFGLDAAIYPDNTIIYVYDFNKNPVKRLFHKFEKKKGGWMPTTIVNFNTERLKPGKQVWIMVLNANKFLYDVKVSHELFTFDSQPSPLFTELFQGNTTGIMGKLLTNVTNSLQSGSEDGLIQDRLTEIIQAFKCFNEAVAQLKAAIAEAYSPCATYATCNTVNLEKMLLFSQDIQLRIGALKQQLGDLPKQLEEEKKTQASLAQTKTKMEQLQQEISTLQAKPPGQQTGLAAKQQELQKMLALNISEKLTNSAAREVVLKRRMEILQELELVKNSLPADSTLIKLVITARSAVAQNFIHWAGPFTTDGDLMKVTVDIKSNTDVAKKTEIPEYSNAPIVLHLPVIHRFFVSFSSGPFFAVMRHMQNKSYSWQAMRFNDETADNTRYKLVESGYTPQPLGFSALANLEWKLYRNLAIGPSFGVGITIEKHPRPVYLGGISVFAGNKHQFAFTGGLALMQVDKLNQNWQNIADKGTIYAAPPPAPEYHKELKSGFFLSLTYTLFTIQRKTE